MSRSELAIVLSKLKTFTSPSIKDEQYPTESEAASTIIWDAYMNKDIEGMIVADLGCGTGILGIGALIMNAREVIFIDKDETALKLAKENLRQTESELDEAFSTAEFVQFSIEDFFSPVDTVLMNPPFGTVKRGADKLFLEKAMQVAKVIYSLHKASTKDYLIAFFEQKGWKIKYTKYFSMNLKNTMAHHKKRLQKIDVVCFGIERAVV